MKTLPRLALFLVLPLVSLLGLVGPAAAVQPITDGFTNLPSSGPYCDLYGDLTAHSRPTPADDCHTISGADMLAFLRLRFATELAAELTNDPTVRNYAGHTSANQAAMVNNQWVGYAPGSSANGYTGAVSLLAVVTVLNNLGASNGMAGYTATWDVETTTTALRGASRVINSNTAFTLTLASSPPSVVGVLDTVYLVDPSDTHDPRVTVINAGFPYAPNAVTSSDVAAALTP